MSDPCYFPDPVVVQLRFMNSESYVPGDGAVCKKACLRNITEMSLPPKKGLLVEWLAIEQDAALVLMLHRPEYYLEGGSEQKEKVKNDATVLLLKNRNGPTGDVSLHFIKHLLRFQNRSWRDDEGDYASSEEALQLAEAASQTADKG